MNLFYLSILGVVLLVGLVLIERRQRLRLKDLPEIPGEESVTELSDLQTVVEAKSIAGILTSIRITTHRIVIVRGSVMDNDAQLLVVFNFTEKPSKSYRYVQWFGGNYMEMDIPRSQIRAGMRGDTAAIEIPMDDAEGEAQKTWILTENVEDFLCSVCPDEKDVPARTVDSC